ncbi:MAG: CHAP domain-containing protein [Caulobacterales bacterium]
MTRMEAWRRLRLLGAVGALAGLAACASIPYAYDQPGAARPAWRPYGAQPAVEYPLSPLQCVPFARQASGIEIYGDANTWWAQAAGKYQRSTLPAVGSVMVLRGYNTTTRGHVAVVTAILSDREVLVDQANWMNGGEITRRVPVLDVSPANDWSEVRVWWIPTNAWGARVYEGEGFIHRGPLIVASTS